MAMLTPRSAGVLALVTALVEGPRLLATLPKLSAHDALLLATAGLMAFATNLTGNLVIGHLSALAHQVKGARARRGGAIPLAQ